MHAASIYLIVELELQEKIRCYISEKSPGLSMHSSIGNPVYKVVGLNIKCYRYILL